MTFIACSPTQTLAVHRRAPRRGGPQRDGGRRGFVGVRRDRRLGNRISSGPKGRGTIENMTALVWATFGVIVALVAILAAALFSANGRHDELGGRIDGLGGRIDGLGGRIDALGVRIDTLGTDLTSRIDDTNARLDGMNARLDGMSARLDRLGVG